MVKPYVAVAVQTEVIICRHRERISENLNRCLQIIDFIHTLSLGATGLPVKLLVFPEFFLQGWAMFYISHSAHVRDIAITIPGEETDKLGEKAKEHECYICGAALATETDWPDRFFNIAFIIGPNGKVIHKYYKLNTTTNTIETSVSPHDMYDAFVKRYGDSLDAFFPVTDTEIGKLGTFICYDGCFPEVARGLAVNGAEVLLRPTAFVQPGHSTPSKTEGWWYLANRARALDNVCYLIAPNWGGTGGPRPVLRSFTPGVSMIVDYQGRVLASADYVGETFIWSEIDIELLRYYRAKTRMGNFVPELRSEVYSKIYERPRYPKNKFLEKPPETLPEAWPVVDESIKQCLQEGIFTPPATTDEQGEGR